MHAQVHLRKTRQRGIQVADDGGGGNVTGAGKNPGKFIVWGLGIGLFFEATHVTVPWEQLTAYKRV